MPGPEHDSLMRPSSNYSSLHRWALLAALVITALVYWPGLQGGFLFDDYPNIIDNQGVQPHDAGLPSLVRAVLASPASDFKRPLASLSFAANYLVTGLDPYWMKLTNLGLHLLNGLLVFLLARLLLRSVPSDDQRLYSSSVATLIATGWMLLPINLTSVLYVVQRMESLANLFVLLGLIGYVISRRRMLGLPSIAGSTPTLLRRSELGSGRFSSSTRNFILCLISVTIPTIVGTLAKETAVMLPLYALLIEWNLFRFCKPQEVSAVPQNGEAKSRHRDNRIIGLFVSVLILPMIMGLVWLLPGIMKPETWATRDFTLGTRLLSEARIVVDYIAWTLLPTPSVLSFYHDDFQISTGLLTPWTTLASVALLAALITLTLWLRTRKPLTALGIALFLGCQLLTGTILPLELIYEHRNYFASFGLLLTVVPLLAVPRAFPLALPRWVLLAGLMLCWATLTGLTAHAWGNPLRLAEDLAARAPQSPRAQYELGRTYIIYSRYDPASPFTQLVYAPLERSAALPGSSILPEQALIFMNARMHLPLKDAWWDSLIAKLQARKPGVQDESSLAALTQCAHEDRCKLPSGRMIESFMAALAHPNPSARLLATYGDYAWNVLNDHALGERMAEEAVKSSPDEPAYRITLIQMLTALDKMDEARKAYRQLETLNIGGRLDSSLAELRARLPASIPNHTSGIE
jgi:protein O-mannosyl-transferase